MDFREPSPLEQARLNQRKRERMERDALGKCWNEDALTFEHDFEVVKGNARKCRKCHYWESELDANELTNPPSWWLPPRP